jgi:hypothetical protein
MREPIPRLLEVEREITLMHQPKSRRREKPFPAQKISVHGDYMRGIRGESFFPGDNED